LVIHTLSVIDTLVLLYRIQVDSSFISFHSFETCGSKVEWNGTNQHHPPILFGYETTKNCVSIVSCVCSTCWIQTVDRLSLLTDSIDLEEAWLCLNPSFSLFVTLFLVAHRTFHKDVRLRPSAVSSSALWIGFWICVAMHGSFFASAYFRTSTTQYYQ
jgi:hypothetical protein